MVIKGLFLRHSVVEQQNANPLYKQIQQETGELPKDLDDVTFENEYLQSLYETDYKYGYIKWYIRGDRLVIEHSGNSAKNIDGKRKEMKLQSKPEVGP